MVQPLNAATYALNSAAEQCRLTAYDDKQPNKTLKPGDKLIGTLSIGYGQTGINPFTGKPIKIGDTWTPQQAQQVREENMTAAEDAVIKALPGVPLTGNQLGALSDFTYNLGVGGFLKSSVYRAVKAGRYSDVPILLNAYVYSKGVKMQGLVKRRADEGRLFATDSIDVHKTLLSATTPSIKVDSVGLLGSLLRLFVWVRRE